MKVRTKMISALALLFAVMIALAIVVQLRVFMPSFAQLERDDARASMRRIEGALCMRLEALELAAADWGNWADVYGFVAQPARKFVNTNITPAALKQLQIDALFIIDGNGSVAAAAARDPQTAEPMELELAPGNTVPGNFPWLRDLASGHSQRGLLKTNRGILMAAAAPILDGNGGGPSRGLVIMGKLLTTQELRRIGGQAQAIFAMTSARRENGADLLVESGTAAKIQRPYADIYGNPLMSFEVEVPRRITERGRDAVAYASTCLILAGIVALAVLVMVLNRVVLGPLARVTRHAAMMAQGADLTARLDLPGTDEVAVLAREFDRMVANAADTRRQLMDQSFQAGFAEFAKGVLHNLGNAMTPLGVRLSTLGGRLRDAPAADVELAAVELAAEPVGSARHSDLHEFVRLGCAELRTSLEDAQTDVMVIQRQTIIVQTALTELMRSTRNEHVRELVRLPDLVSQTLEIVPDACRQRLIVESDESLRRVGTVEVARTVLRLVLQNLIINAADSVREAGREKGFLKVAAEIVREPGCAQLHLRCEDNGVGIAKHNLQRVFDQGFSTKSRDTNYGIGLHWCANAVAGLGGRIWAASEGPGRGASLHLMLPLTAQAQPIIS